MSLEPSSWLLELGAAARKVEPRAGVRQLRGHPIRAWSRRRAGARARRDRVLQALSGAVVEAEPTPPRVQAEEPTALLARVGAYTSSAV
jgi:hypothetical protein